MTELHKSFLSLIRLGIGHHSMDFPSNPEWPAIEALAVKQGLSAVALDGIEELRKFDYKTLFPDKAVLTQWIGEVLQGYEYRYEMCRRTIAEMASFYNAHGFKMMILKGIACSHDWNKPEHRPIGDIDIWLFGRQKEADLALKTEKGIKIEDSFEHHTVFYWRDFMVENHYDFIDVHHRKSSPQLERILKSLGEDDSHYVDLYGERVYLPSPNLLALFLLRHSMEHFASTELTLRQLLDWAFFVEKHAKEVNWDWLIGLLEEFGMTPAFNVFNAICVEDLGFEAGLFHQVQFNPFLKDRGKHPINDVY